MLHYLMPVIPLTIVGAVFFKRKTLAYGFPVLLVFAKTLLTRPSPLFFFTLAALIVSVVLIRKAKERGGSSVWAVARYALGAVLVYEAITNLGVWVIGGCVPNSPRLYALTAAGFLQCYFKALPYAGFHLLRDIPLAVLLVQGCLWLAKFDLLGKVRLLKFQHGKV